MDIIAKLNIQLTKVKNILTKETSQGEYTYNYKIYEDKCKFLDYFELQSYLATTTIENTVFLKGINELCVEISDFWNNELQKIPMKHFKEDFVFVGKYWSGSSTLDFHAFRLLETEIINYNTITGKRNFVEKYNFSDINIKIIADRCNIILNLITAAYPVAIPQNLKYNIPEYFNVECYNLFKYLVEKYVKTGKIKFINIFYFLKNEVDKKKFVFSFKQHQYKTFILKEYDIEIKKFAKATYRFPDEEVPILNELTKNFLLK